MSTLATLVVKLKTDLSQFNSGMDKATAKMRKTGESMQSIGWGMTRGLSVPLAGVGAVAVNAASNLNESMSKTAQVFGKATKSVFDFSQTAEDSLGMTQQQALEATSTLGNLFVSMGLGRQAAAGMSMSTVKLAGDLASFNNIDPTAALEKLRAGLIGEYEPLRSMGVNLSEAAVQAKALQMGLAKNAKGLTPLMKMHARYALIMEQTKTAQGDFARTSNGLANTMRIAKASVGDLAAKLGVQLLPIATLVAHAFVGLVKKVSALVSRFGALSPRTRALIILFGGILIAMGPLLMGLGTLMIMASMAAGGLSMLGGVITGLYGIILSPVGAVLAVGAAIVALYIMWRHNTFGIRDVTASVWDWLVRTFHSGVAAVSDAVASGVNWVNAALNNTWQFIVRLFNSGVNIVLGAVRWLLNGGLMLFQLLFVTIPKLAYAGLTAMVGIIKSAFQFSVNLFISVIKFFVNIWMVGFNFLNKLTGGRLTAIANIMCQAFIWIIGLFRKGWQAVITVSRNVLRGLIEKVGNAMAGIADSIASVFERIPGIGKSLASGLRSAAGNIRGAAAAVANAVAGPVKDGLAADQLALGKFVVKATETGGKLKDGFLAALKGLGAGISERFGKLMAPIEKLFAGGGMDAMIKSAMEAGAKKGDITAGLNTVPPALKKIHKAAGKVGESFNDMRKKAGQAIAYIDWQFQHGLITQTEALRGKIASLKQVMEAAFQHGLTKQAAETGEQIKKLQAQLDKLSKTTLKFSLDTAISGGKASIEKALAPFKAAVDAIKSVASLDAEMDRVGPKVDKVLNRAGALMRALAKRAQSASFVNAVGNSSKIGSYISKAMAPFKPAIEAIQAVASLDSDADKVGGNVEKVLNRMGALVRALAGRVGRDGYVAAVASSSAIADNLAAAMKPFKPAIDAIKAVASLNPDTDKVAIGLGRMLNRMGAMVRALAGRVGRDGYKDAVASSAEIADSLSKAMAPFKPAIDAIKAVASLDPDADKVAIGLGRMLNRMGAMVRALAGRVGRDGYKDAVASSAEIADSLSKAMAPFKPAIDAIKAVASLDPDADKVAMGLGRLLNRMGAMVRALAGRVGRDGYKDAVASSAEIADSLSKAMTPFKPAIDAIKAVATLDADADRVGGKIDKLLNRLGTIVRGLADRASRPAFTSAANSAGAIANSLVEAMKPFKPALDAIRAVASLDVDADKVGGKIDILLNRLGTMVRALAERAKRPAFAGAAEASAQIADNIAAAMKPFKPALDAIRAVAGLDTDADKVGDKIQAFLNRLGAIVRDLAERAERDGYAAAAKSAAAISGYLKDSVAFIKPGVDAIKALADMKTYQKIGEKMKTFAGQLDIVIANITTLAEKYKGKMKDAASFGGFASDISNGVSAGVDALTKMANYKPATVLPARMKTFKDNIGDLSDMITAMHTSMRDTAYPAAQGFATFAANVKDSVTDAIESIRNIVWNYEGQGMSLSNVPDITTWVANAFKNMVDAVSDAGYDLGHDWLSNIIDGLNSRKSDLESLMKYIRGLFPSSPAKYGAWRKLPDGAAVGAGFTAALVGGLSAGPVATALGQMRAALGGDYGSPAYAGAGAAISPARGGGATTIVLQYQPTFSFADEREAAQKILPVLERALAERDARRW